MPIVQLYCCALLEVKYLILCKCQEIILRVTQKLVIETQRASNILCINNNIHWFELEY